MQTVLMVDDESTSLKLYERILGDVPGLTAVSRTSALSALWWCTDNDPDLVVVDYQMPDLNGLDFIEGFRKLGKSRHIPIVMITSTEERSLRHRALELGANEFLLKPIDHVEFKVRAKNMLILRSNARMLADRAALLAEEVRIATVQTRREARDILCRLTQVAEYRDDNTASHIIRVGHLVAAVAAALGLSPEEQELLSLAASMHDIGKVAIPHHILMKPGPLTPVEWDIMKTHTTAGFEILRDSPSAILTKGAEIALSHHEKFDGSGYPLGSAGDSIPISGRITAVCDVFDALLSTRPHKAPWPLEKVTAYITSAGGSAFDPRVVSAFNTCLPELIAIRRQFWHDAVA
jgi:two-component system, response regulator RpfG